MPEDAFCCGTTTNALDHGGMIAFIGEDDEPRKQPAQGGKRGVVGNKAGGKKKRRFLAVQFREFAFQLDVIMRGAGNIARAARPRSGSLQRGAHCRQHLGVLAHAEIVVATPHGDRARPVVRVQIRCRVSTAPAQNVGKDAVAVFAPKICERFAETGAVGVGQLCLSGRVT